MTLSRIALALAWMTSSLAAQAADATLMLRQPAVSKTHLAFVYGGDLWLADRNGGNARRLTSHAASEFAPRFSPDGSSIAFSASYDGNTDVYVIGLNGGAPRRRGRRSGRRRRSARPTWRASRCRRAAERRAPPSWCRR